MFAPSQTLQSHFFLHFEDQLLPATRDTAIEWISSFRRNLTRSSTTITTTALVHRMETTMMKDRRQSIQVTQTTHLLVVLLQQLTSSFSGSTMATLSKQRVLWRGIGLFVTPTTTPTRTGQWQSSTSIDRFCHMTVQRSSSSEPQILMETIFLPKSTSITTTAKQQQEWRWRWLTFYC